MSYRNAADWVALILAVGIASALNVITAAAMTMVVFEFTHPANPVPHGLGENTTQILTGWGGGMVGVLGAYVGYRFGSRKRDDDDAAAAGS